MSDERLKYWMTLPHEELKRRVDLELKRTDLSFAEGQLLDAALERLKSYREPIRQTRKESKMKDDETATSSETPPTPPPSDKPPKASRKKSTTKAKEPTVKKAKTRNSNSRKAVTGKTAKAKKAASNGGSRLDPEAKVVKTGKENPFREGTESWERINIVLKSSGQTVKTIRAKAGLKPTTLNTAIKEGLVKVVA
jgi:outer membrane biosynthesis protein TonB